MVRRYLSVSERQFAQVAFVDAVEERESLPLEGTPTDLDEDAIRGTKAELHDTLDGLELFMAAPRFNRVRAADYNRRTLQQMTDPECETLLRWRRTSDFQDLVKALDMPPYFRTAYRSRYGLVS